MTIAGLRVGLVWAQAANGVIGAAGEMPWYLPEDLAHFKAVTAGRPVIMGRKTWDSLPPRFRPLSDRQNIVVTRQEDWRADGVDSVGSVSEAFALAAGADGFVWVIGGAQIFADVIDNADRLEVTEINATFDGDTVAPGVSDGWQLVDSDPDAGWLTSRTGLEYRFLRYEPAPLR